MRTEFEELIGKGERGSLLDDVLETANYASVFSPALHRDIRNSEPAYTDRWRQLTESVFIALSEILERKD